MIRASFEVMVQQETNADHVTILVKTFDLPFAPTKEMSFALFKDFQSFHAYDIEWSPRTKRFKIVVHCNLRTNQSFKAFLQRAKKEGWKEYGG